MMSPFGVIFADEPFDGRRKSGHVHLGYVGDVSQAKLLQDLRFDVFQSISFRFLTFHTTERRAIAVVVVVVVFVVVVDTVDSRVMITMLSTRMFTTTSASGAATASSMTSSRRRS